MSWNNIVPADLLGVWKTSSVEETPELVLTHWSVRELEDGDRHFVGYNITECEGRVSSKIVEYDPETRIGTTRSGRKYQLEGEPGLHPDAEWTWSKWKRINKVDDYKDVSSLFCKTTEDLLHDAWNAEGKAPELFPILGDLDEDDMDWAKRRAQEKVNFK